MNTPDQKQPHRWLAILLGPDGRQAETAEMTQEEFTRTRAQVVENTMGRWLWVWADRPTGQVDRD